MNFNSPPFRKRTDIAGLKVTIMGLGLNGGGLSSARFFASSGAKVTITDKKSAAELKPSIEALSGFPDIRYVLGTHEIADFRDADLVIKNPGVKLEGNEYLQASRSIETDISIFLRFSPSPIIAVTGSKGKSSTVSALHFGLKELGYKAFLGGNITVSPLTFLDQTDGTTPVVLELSSWQLADLKDRKILKPRIAILTPVMSDHQNWYGGMEPYVADKKLIYADQDEKCHLLCNRDDDWGPIFASETGAQVHWYSSKPLEGTIPGAWIDDDGRGMMRLSSGKSFEILPSHIAVPGSHMRQNLLNAAQAIALFGAPPASIGSALARFPGIVHRLEYFLESDGVKWYNDSAATIPEAVAAAINSFDRPIILLSGGTDKNLDFTPLADVAGKTKKMFLLSGSGTDKLMPMLDERNVPWEGPFANLESLVLAAKKASSAGDIVVFSPGATSFGMFANEFDRGNKFRETVALILQK